MNIVVLIPHHRSRESLDVCIRSVDGVPVVVVDDSPSGGLSLDGIEVIRSAGSTGFARAVNAGLEHCQRSGFDHVLVLNDDARLRSGCVRSLSHSWTENDGAIAPVVHEPDGPIYGIRLNSLGRVHMRRSPGPVQAVSGAAMLIRSSERFDSSYAHGFEDIELCRRLLSRELQVRVIMDAHCDHEGGGTVPRRSRLAQRHAMSGHLRFAKGPFQQAAAVALGVGQVVADGGPAERLLGVVDGVLDHVRSTTPA
jgi:GT2 family glycosyltransferase